MLMIPLPRRLSLLGSPCHRAGVSLLLITLLALPLLWLHLGRGDATDMMELFNLVPIREAYRDGHWLMPTLNGLPRLEKPPLPVWVPAALAQWSGRNSLWILRLPSVVCALLACYATYFLACRFSRDRFLGLASAIGLALMIQFLRHARLASYDIYATCFTTLGLLGLVLLAEADASPTAPSGGFPLSSEPPDPLPHAPGRPFGVSWQRLAGILLAGVSLGLAVLSKGPVPVATVCLPVGLWLLIFHRRRRVFVDLTLAALLSILVFLPWLIAIGQRYPGAWGVWYREILQNSTAQSNNPAQTAADLRRPFYYYFQFFIWVFPLTPTLVAGLALPFLPVHSSPSPSARETRGRWLAWIVTVAGLVLLSCLAEKKIRYALPLFPAAALLVAAVWQEFLRLKAERRIEPAAQCLLVIQALLFFGASIAIAAAHALTLPAVQRWLRLSPAKADALSSLLHDGLATMPPSLWLTLAMLLLLTGLYLWIEQHHRQFLRAAIAFAIGGWLLNLTWTQAYYGGGAFHASAERKNAEAMVAIAGSRPIYTLSGVYNPWLPVLFYADRELPPITLNQLQTLHASDAPLYLLLPVPNHSDSDPVLRGAAHAAQELVHLLGHPLGEPLLELHDGHYPLALYRLNPPAPNAMQPVPNTAPFESGR